MKKISLFLQTKGICFRQKYDAFTSKAFKRQM